MSFQPSSLGAEGVVMHPVDLDAGMVASLNSMFKLLGARLARPWRIQVDENAPVYIAHADSNFAKRARRERPLLILVHEAGAPVPQHAWRLQRPFRADAVLETIKGLDAALQAAAAAPASAATRSQPQGRVLASAPESEPPSFGDSGLDAVLPSAFGNVDEEFALHLAAMLADPVKGQVLEGRYDDGSKLVIDHEAGVFFSDARALDHLAARRLPTSTAHHKGIGNRVSVRRSLPIAELIWTTGLASAAAGTLRGLPDGAGLELLCWPPFGRADRSLQHIQMAAALSRRTLSLEHLAQAAGGDTATAARFAAACLYAGYARVGGQSKREAGGQVQQAPAGKKADAPQREIKIVFAGSVGAGKTTAIRSVSDVQTLDTEVAASAEAGTAKTSTTVAIDYGQAEMGSATRLLLYGTPGQARFSFMWKAAAQGASGVVILIDNAAKDPLADLRTYMDAFAEFGERGAVVVGVARTESNHRPSMEEHVRVVAARGWRVPVLAVDARERGDVTTMLNSLLCILDAPGGPS